MLIGREKEQEILSNAYEAQNSQFILLYGRRRIGKTFLIDSFFYNNFFFKFTGSKRLKNNEQLNSFILTFIEYFNNRIKINNWLEAFKKLEQEIQKSNLEKKVIFIDELSWIYRKNNDLLAALELFWNNFASARNDVLLIVSSSVASFLIDKILHDKGGLHNRCTVAIKLNEFNLYEVNEYLTKYKEFNLSKKNIIDIYNIIGGIPYYWNLISKNDSASSFIDKLFYAKDALLKNEFEYVFKSLFDKYEPYIDIIKVLSNKRSGILKKEIAKKLGIDDNGNLSKKIKDLENCGFIRLYYLFDDNKAIYIQLIDNYLMFYLKNQETFKLNDEQYWSHSLNTPRINSFNGLSYELVCLKHINQIKKALGISGVLTETYALYDTSIDKIQIDLIIKRADKVINLCEIKYYIDEFVIDKEFDQKSRNKIARLFEISKNKYTIQFTLITTYGIKKGMYSSLVNSLVTMEDLFEKN